MQNNRIIHNSYSGETITFLFLGKETNGEKVVFEDHLAPNHASPPPHVHRHQDETFTVTKGQLKVMMKGIPTILNVGESVTVPRNTPHTISPMGGEETVTQVEFRPALDTETMFRTLAEAGKSGRINLLYIALIARDTQTGFTLAGIPLVLQDLLFGALAFIGRRRGYCIVN